MAKKPLKNENYHKVKGNITPLNVNTNALKKIKAQQKKNNPTISKLLNGIISGNISLISQSITLIESTNTEHAQKAKSLIKKCLPHTKPSIRIGITGVPGVGKSTFIESLGNYLLQLGKKVAVLAIDPTSSLSQGSILGDKTRMEALVKHKNAFVRPSPAGNTLGGVARKTRESVIICEAAGYDVILIETVGVGQSETAVHGMVDFFLLLNLAGAGDELQGIKRGIIEMADAIVINKADGTNLKPAKAAMLELKRALHLFPAKESGWQPQSLLCSALHNQGIEQIWLLIMTFVETTKKNGYFYSNRKLQNIKWLLNTVEAEIKSDFYNNLEIKLSLEKQVKLVEDDKITPIEAAEFLLKKYKIKTNRL